MTNVVLVHTDDSGRYIGPYGYNVPTPNLQDIAEESLLFRQAVCADPTCSPSRGALMTGQAPHSNGLIGLTHRGFAMDDYDRHLVNVLSGHGYRTVLCGQQHEAEGESRAHAAKTTLGYDVVPEEPGPDDVDIDTDHRRTRRDVANTQAAVEWIRDRPEGPYFLSLGLNNPHRSFPHEDQMYDPAYVQPPAPMPDVPATREDMAGYLTAATYVDDCVGRVYAALADTDQLDETVFVFTTDHGIPFRDMKCNLFDGGIGVSLITRFPDGPHGAVSDALVSQIDLFPTLCEYLDLEIPDYVQGTSMLPIVRGETDTTREQVFSEVNYHASYEPKRCVRTDRYKYIQRFDDHHDGYLLANLNGGPSKEFLLENGIEDQRRPREALYDLYHDPNERNNRIDDPEYRDVYADLAARLEEWMRVTDDPLLSGPVPMPENARIHRRACISNQEDRYEGERR